MAEYIKREYILSALSIFRGFENGNEHFLNGIETAKEIVKQATAADVLPVIRCRDCWKHDYDNCQFYEFSGQKTEDDFFCADGERRKNGDKEVVRCQNCVYNQIPDSPNVICDKFYGAGSYNGYCAWGKPREDGD